MSPPTITGIRRVARYAEPVRTVTILLPEDLCLRADAEADRLGISTSELVRRGLAAILPGPAEASSTNAWLEFLWFAEAPAQPRPVDVVVYAA